MASLLNIGRGLVNHKFLPYDAEIEYLESSGGQWIDTGIQYIQGDTIELNGRFLILSHDDGILTMIPWNTPGDTRFMFAVVCASSHVNFGMSYNNLPGDMNSDTIKFPILDSNFHIWHYEGKTLAIDDNLSYLTNTDDYNQGRGTLRLFYRYNGGCPTAIKYYKQYRNNTLIIDLIPVRISTTGYLYDKVSGQLFGNSGTGSFILGPDKQ